MEEFLLFGKSIPDPWNRICFLREPIILMVEFCQIQGPRPLLWYPIGSCTTHILEEIAIWLMSSENMHGNFALLYNQQMGVYVLAQYAIMLDITARALQRPFVLAFILSNQPTADQIVNFQRVITKTLLPILRCNRCYIHSLLNYASQLVEDGKLKNIQSYYSTAGNAQQIVIVSDKIKGIVQQLNPWYEKFMQKIYPSEDVPTNCCNCECGEDQFRKFVQILCRKQSSQLINLLELAPCIVSNCSEILTKAYKELLGNQISSMGIMFSGMFPVMRSVFGANTQMDEEERSDEQELYDSQIEATMLNLATYSERSFIGTEDTLKSLSFRLIRCIYPLLAGEKLMILASQQRTTTGIDLLNKLVRLHPRKRFDKIEWISQQERINDSIVNPLAGFTCDREKSYELSEQSAKHDSIIIDLNNHRIRCHKYSGKFLRHLYGNRIYPTDKAATDFVVAIITDIFQLILLARYISPDSVVNHLGLTVHDQMILYNLLIEFDLTRYIHLKSKIRKLQEKMLFVLQRF